MFAIDHVPGGTFTDQELALVRVANPRDLSPQERARRLELLLRQYVVPSVQGTPLHTSLIHQISPIASGGALANIVHSISLGQIDFGSDERTFSFLVEYVRQLLGQVEEANALTQMAGGQRGYKRFDTLQTTFGGPEAAWFSINPRETRVVVARFLQLYAPDLLRTVPSQVLRRLGIEAEPGELEERRPEERREEPRPRRPSTPTLPRVELRPEFLPKPEVVETPPAVQPTLSPVPSPPPPTRSEERSISLAQRYRPCHLDQIFDQVRAVNQLRGIVRTGVVGARGSAVFLWGPPGTGKTTAATAFARDYFIKLGLLPAHTEGPCPDLPREAFTKITRHRLPQDPSLAATTLNAILGSTITSGALSNISGLKRVVLIDDFSDFPPSVVERLKPLLENYTGNAIVLITTNNDPARTFSDSAGQALLSRSQIIHFTPIPSELVARRLHEIANAEGIVFPGLDEAIDAATTASHGDLGLAIGGLQSAYNEFLGASGG